MARKLHVHLLRVSGQPLLVWDRESAGAEQHAARHGCEHARLGELAERCSMICLSLGSSAEVREVIEGKLYSRTRLALEESRAHQHAPPVHRDDC